MAHGFLAAARPRDDRHARLDSEWGRGQRRSTRLSPWTLPFIVTGYMQDRQPRSGLATVRRDFSSNSATDAFLASAPPAAATKRSALSDSLRKAIQDGVASREVDNSSPSSSPLTASQKRPLSPETAPTSKKRQLPRSWTAFESSSATFSRGSSQSVYFESRSSTSSVLPLDMLSHGDQEDPESSSAPSSEPKPSRRPAEISLSDEQKYILELVMQGKNVFYTGSAGVSDSPWLLHTVCQSYHCRSSVSCVERRTTAGCPFLSFRIPHILPCVLTWRRLTCI